MTPARKSLACLLSASLVWASLPAPAAAASVAAAARTAAPAGSLAMPAISHFGPGQTAVHSAAAPSLEDSGLPVLSAPVFGEATTMVPEPAVFAASLDGVSLRTAARPASFDAPASVSPRRLSPGRSVAGPGTRKRVGQVSARERARARGRAVAGTMRGLRGIHHLPSDLAGGRLDRFYDRRNRGDKDLPVRARGAKSAFRRGHLEPAPAELGDIPASRLDQSEGWSPPTRKYPRPKWVGFNYWFFRTLLAPFVHLFFGPRVRGYRNIPKAGPALLLPNHVTWIDVFLVSFAVRRPIRFLMYKGHYDAPHMHWFVRLFAPIPIEPGNPEQVAEALDHAREAMEDGDIVAIFPEGSFTKNGTLGRFKRGMETISADLNAPVIPVHLDNLWVTPLSLKPVSSILDFLRRSVSRSTVRIGTPLYRSTVDTARDAVEQLSAYSMAERVESKYGDLGFEFRRAAYRNWFRPAWSDSTGVSVSFGKALTGATLVGSRLRRIVGAADTVGIVMPATVGGAIANTAVALLGKTSANLNFTASREAIAHSIEKAGLRHVVTSRKFLDAFARKKGWRLEEALEGVELVFLEDVAKSIPGWRKAMTFLAMTAAAPFLRPAYWIANALGLSGLARPATVIFTSGSTGLPKGVALTHRNILSNVEMIRQVSPLGPQDTVLGVLPFFHSFGYTVTLWTSALVGAKTVYHPDPFDAETIGNLAEEHGATTLLGTPTFLRRYRERIPAEQFKTLRLVIAGAEKLWRRDVEAFESKFGVRPMEGYGATETSPVASVGVPDWVMRRSTRERYPQWGFRENSVGRPLPGVAVRIVDPETGDFLPAGKQGLIMIKGPNVMSGYLDDPEKTAEVLRDGWYNSGDIGYKDRDGFLYIEGRASRFAKLAGEMVPLGAVEEKLQKAAGVEERSFGVFAVPDAKMGERLVVLHTGFEGTPEELLEKLGGDLPRLWTPRSDMFFEIEAFPVLGSGKADLKALQKLADELGGDRRD
jgi:acyl-[acyl-carrier-protein]-phospholipid O-acyltransferase/long-chain-fatty-acid--[acyl-carrier-protein] ligase